MKQIISIITFLLLSQFGTSIRLSAQEVTEKVSWEYNLQKEGDYYQIVFDATLLESDWHFWDIHLQSDFLIPTQIIIKDSSDFNFHSELLVDGKVATINDADFGELKYYESDMKFTINFSPKKESTEKIVATIIYQACNKTLCMPPQFLTFEIFLNK